MSVGASISATLLALLGDGPLLAALAIALITVGGLLFGRYDVRLRRLRLIRDYVRAYPIGNDSSGKADTTNPSFDIVRSKYSGDVDRSDTETPTTPKGIIADLNTTIDSTRFFFNWSDLRLTIASLPYLVIVTAGFDLALSPAACDAASGSCAWHKPFSILAAGGIIATADAPLDQLVANTLTIATIAFVGAYLSSLRYLIQSVAVFDLSGYTFIRQAGMIVISVIAVLILYRALPDPTQALKFGTVEKATSPQSLSTAWMLLALALGLLPGSVLQFVLVKTGSLINWVKQSDDRFIEWTRVVPLDAIDGIDYFTRFRLEECGISDVQSLATYNPIMLHIETPYGIYQTVDWIAQAQLCCVVGLDRFLLLREFNVRTIFDLERALKQGRDVKDEDRKAFDSFDRIYAAVLLAPTGPMKNLQIKSTAKFLIPGPDGKIKESDAVEFSTWAMQEITKDPLTSSKVIEHLMDWIGDDLHVRRLRRLWNEISTRLGPSSLELTPDDTIRAGPPPLMNFRNGLPPVPRQ